MLALFYLQCFVHTHCVDSSSTGLWSLRSVRTTLITAKWLHTYCRARIRRLVSIVRLTAGSGLGSTSMSCSSLILAFRKPTLMSSTPSSSASWVSMSFCSCRIFAMYVDVDTPLDGWIRHRCYREKNGRTVRKGTVCSGSVDHAVRVLSSEGLSFAWASELRGSHEVQHAVWTCWLTISVN